MYVPTTTGMSDTMNHRQHPFPFSVDSRVRVAAIHLSLSLPTTTHPHTPQRRATIHPSTSSLNISPQHLPSASPLNISPPQLSSFLPLPPYQPPSQPTNLSTSSHSADYTSLPQLHYYSKYFHSGLILDSVINTLGASNSKYTSKYT